MQKILLVVGEIASGKDTFSQMVRSAMSKQLGFTSIKSYSELIKVIFEVMGYAPTRREPYLKFGKFLAEELGDNVYNDAIYHLFTRHGCPHNVVINGIRYPDQFNYWPKKAEQIDAVCNSVYIEAPEQIRLDRDNNRKRFNNETRTIDEFRAESSANTEAQVKSLRELCDEVIVNDGDLLDINNKTIEFLKKYKWV